AGPLRAGRGRARPGTRLAAASAAVSIGRSATGNGPPAGGAPPFEGGGTGPPHGRRRGVAATQDHAPSLVPGGRRLAERSPGHLRYSLLERRRLDERGQPEQSLHADAGWTLDHAAPAGRGAA